MKLSEELLGVLEKMYEKELKEQEMVSDEERVRFWEDRINFYLQHIIKVNKLNEVQELLSDSCWKLQEVDD